MKAASSHKILDEEESSDHDHVTIELYHNIPLGTTEEEASNTKTENIQHVTQWPNFRDIWNCFCCCKRGQDFERLTLNENTAGKA